MKEYNDISDKFRQAQEEIEIMRNSSMMSYTDRSGIGGGGASQWQLEDK
jgi:hypothetical protein